MSKTEQFIQLQRDLRPYKDAFGDAIEQMLNKEVTKYPIFVVHQQDVEIGVEIIAKEKVNGSWTVNATTLEELVAKQIIFQDKVEDFKDVYKDPEEFICLFILSELGAQFIWMPRKGGS